MGTTNFNTEVNGLKLTPREMFLIVAFRAVDNGTQNDTERFLMASVTEAPRHKRPVLQLVTRCAA